MLFKNTLTKNQAQIKFKPKANNKSSVNFNH